MAKKCKIYQNYDSNNPAKEYNKSIIDDPLCTYTYKLQHRKIANKDRLLKKEKLVFGASKVLKIQFKKNITSMKLNVTTDRNQFVRKEIPL